MGLSVGDAAAFAEAEAEDEDDAAAAEVGRTDVKGETELLEIAPTQPATANAVSDTSAAHLRHLRLPTTADFMTRPSRMS